MSAHDPTPAEGMSVMELLAYYDVRGVGDQKLLSIFRCSMEDLAGARKSEEYTEAHSKEIAKFEATRATLDDTWDEAERRALGNLVDSLDHTSDPRMLLNVAMAANKASRRNVAAMPENQRRIIDVTPPPGATTTVVQLRSRFLAVLQDDAKVRQAVAREVHISVTNHSNVHEDMTPREVQALMKGALGIDPQDMVEIGRAGNTEDQFFNFDSGASSNFVKK